MDFLLSLPGPVAGLLVVLAAAAVALAAHGLLRRRIGADRLRAGTEVSGLLYGVLGGVYGVLLAFVLVAVWEDFGEAEAHVEDEVGQLATLHRDAMVFGEPDRTAMRDALAAYVRSVVEDEWPAMATGDESPETAAAYERVWTAYYAVEPEEGRDAIFYEESVGRLSDVAESRRGRVLASRSGVPPTMWLLLALGALLVVGLASMLGSDDEGTHRTSVAALAGTLAAVLFVTVALDRPFGAGITLSRRPFVELTEQWGAAR